MDGGIAKTRAKTIAATALTNTTQNIRSTNGHRPRRPRNGQ
jgi:hypothetical protein